VEWLLGKDAPVDALVELVDENKMTVTPLWAAAKEGHAKVVQCLLGHKANVNWSTGYVMADTALQAVFSYRDEAVISPDRKKIVECLLSHGADTPFVLWHFALEGAGPAVNCLLEGGADVNGKYDGETALLAVTRSNPETEGMVKRFLAGGADTEIENENQQTPLSIATSNQNASVIQTLIAGGALTIKNKEDLLCRISNVSMRERCIALRAQVAQKANTGVITEVGSPKGLELAGMVVKSHRR
jgi:ankyrin repeat protein